jgi:UDP-N-acetylglucosamine--N-acetylmuramyl-(pentapeptide) pyrophosphoryl-undecaprenol N-acetylglucosamine transferase
VPKGEAREIFELPADGPVLLVAGALAGARSLNELVIEAFGEVGPAVLHVSGRRDYESLRQRVRRADYRLIPETDRIGAAYSAADLVLARAGSSVWEIAAAGRPAVLGPYSFATGDHQAKNAEHFVRAGGAIMVRDLDIEDVPDLARSLLDDPLRLQRMGEAMLRAAKPDAADEIAEELIALATA